MPEARIWRAKTSSFQAVYYTSGKLLLQGKDVSEIANKLDTLLGIKNTQVQTKTEQGVPHYDSSIGKMVIEKTLIYSGKE